MLDMYEGVKKKEMSQPKAIIFGYLYMETDCLNHVMIDETWDGVTTTF